MQANHSPPQIVHAQKKFWLAGLIVIVLVGALTLLVSRQKDSRQAISKQPVYTVQEGSLTISFTEAGTIRPREQIILKNEVEGQTVILYLIDEGTEVSKGDLLVELDASQLEDQRVNQQIQVINAEATFINARESLEVVKNQAQADMDQADLDLEFARQDLSQYQEGEYPKQEKEALAKITLAEETLTNAKNTYEWSVKLFEEKYISETELKRDELSWQKARLDLELAKDSLDLLQNFTFKRRMAELESGLKQSAMTLERVKRKAAADIAQAEAKMRATQAEYQQQQDKLDKITIQIGKTKIYAPMDGTVIYATSTKMSWRSNDEPLDEGQSVRERQELIYLPTTSSYNAEVKVHESSLEKIRTGLPVRVSIDALPDRNFSGTVASIAPLPDPTSMFLNPDLKVYNTMIHLDGSGEDLRNGMSCQAEIVVNHYDKALFVPVQAVVRENGQPTVYISTGGGFEPRPVKIGQDNNRMVHVLGGLKVGDVVLLTPPLAEAGVQKNASSPVPGPVQAGSQGSPEAEQQPTLQNGSPAKSPSTERRGPANLSPEQPEKYRQMRRDSEKSGRRERQ